MAKQESFEAVLEEQVAKMKRNRGPVRAWRSALSQANRAAFDAAVDDRSRVSTADLQRAVAAMSGRSLDYGRIYRYREAVRRGEDR
jgi:Mg-chelatase subunit ChlI